MSELEFWSRFLLAVLATWRVTHLLASEDGPADLIVRLRRWLGQGFLGQLMDCFQCLSLWVAAPMALFTSRRPLELPLAWLGLSGAACLLERIGLETVAIQSDPQVGEGGTPNGMLRQDAIGDADRRDAALSPGRDKKHG